MQQPIKIDPGMAQNIVDHAKLAAEWRFFAQRNRGFNMTRYCQGIDQIQNSIWSLQQALVYCISELL